MGNFILNNVESYGLIAIFIFMVTNGFMSVPPSELVISLAGALVAKNNISFIYVFILICTANFIGTYFLYIIGYQIGYKWVAKLRNWLLECNNKITIFLLRFIPSEDWTNAMSQFLKHEGSIWVGVFRCFPMIRSAVSLPAGMSRMKFSRFLIFTFVGISLWTLLWLSLGFYAVEIIMNHKTLLLILTLIFIVPCFYILKHQILRFHNNLVEKYRN